MVFIWAAEDPTFFHFPKSLEEGKGWNKILGCKILGFYTVLSYISFFFFFLAMYTFRKNLPRLSLRSHD